VNAFNRGMRHAELERMVAQFNPTYAGTKDAQALHSRHEEVQLCLTSTADALGIVPVR
jgi:hypothetical protein